jgi:phosphonate degradation associated HDIG domain protein
MDLILQVLCDSGLKISCQFSDESRLICHADVMSLIQHARMHERHKTILDLYRYGGDRLYAGEPVTQLEHAWQCGRLAEKSGANAALQLASWLHDLGHLWVNSPGTPTLRGEDDLHEAVAADILAPLFGSAVAEPVRLHVQAKRYLVTTNRAYAAKLSQDSTRSLGLQGGVMSAQECASFEAQPYFKDALKLRVWDDLGKKKAWFEDSRDDALTYLEKLMQAAAS